MLGVTRQWVHRLTKQPDFPAPVAVLTGGHIWERQDITDWMNARDQAVDNKET